MIKKLLIVVGSALLLVTASALPASVIAAAEPACTVEMTCW